MLTRAAMNKLRDIGFNQADFRVIAKILDESTAMESLTNVEVEQFADEQRCTHPETRALSGRIKQAKSINC